MNSERRHELQQNYLADFLGTQLKKIENYTKVIAAVIVLLVIAVVSWALYRSAAVGARSQATLELLQNAASGDPEALGLVGDRYAETTAGALAKLYQADALLAGGISALFSDREEAQTQFSEALRRYGEAAEMSKHLVIQSRANLGLARTHESMGQTEKAIAAYNRVISIGESEAIVKVAQQRIDRLKSPDTQEFLVWFEQQDFRPADPSQPPMLPSDFSLPDDPDLDLPGISPSNFPDELRGAPTDAPAPGVMTLPPSDATQTPPPTPAPPTDAPPADAPPADASEPAEPAAEPAEPAAEPATDPAAEAAVESGDEPAVEPGDEPAAEPVIEVEPRQ